MFGRIGVNTIFAVALILAALSSQAMARQSVTCTGGYLYLEQTLPDGEEICYETKMKCSGEWTISWLIARPGGNSEAVSGNSSSNARLSGAAAEKQQAALLLLKVKTRDMKLYFKAPASVVASFKRRAGWPGKDKGPIWLPPDSPGPTFPDPPDLNLKTKGYPPNGYPCLGCKPCPPPEGAYCDIVWNNRSAAGRGGLTQSDLSPRMAEQGYRVEGGMIKLVDKSQHVKHKPNN